MDEFVDAVVRAIRQQAARGRAYGQLSVDLNLARSTICNIVHGKRGTGLRLCGLLLLHGLQGAAMKTVNRGRLKRHVQAGRVEARCDYHLIDDYRFDLERDRGRTGWLPARFSTGYGDFVEGQMNLRALDFSASAGRA